MSSPIDETAHPTDHEATRAPIADPIPSTADAPMGASVFEVEETAPDGGRTEPEVNQMLGQQTAAEAEQAPKVRIDVERGDRVKIKDGPFENFEGTVEEVIEQRGLVKVMLIIFNRPTPVDLEYWQVERI